VIFNRICNQVPYRVSWSGLKSALSIRPNLASYEAEAGAGKLGLNKLRRLVNYMDNHRQSFSREERAAIEGMIISPMSCENDQRSRDLAQRGYNILVLLDKADKKNPEIVFVDSGLKLPNASENKEIPPPAAQVPVEVLRLDFPVAEREKVPPPVPPINSEINEQGQLAMDVPAMPDAPEKKDSSPPEPIDPSRMDVSLERRPEIDVWQPVQGPQTGIADAILKIIKEN